MLPCQQIVAPSITLCTHLGKWSPNFCQLHKKGWVGDRISSSGEEGRVTAQLTKPQTCPTFIAPKGFFGKQAHLQRCSPKPSPLLPSKLSPMLCVCLCELPHHTPKGFPTWGLSARINSTFLQVVHCLCVTQRQQSRQFCPACPSVSHPHGQSIGGCAHDMICL